MIEPSYHDHDTLDKVNRALTSVGLGAQRVIDTITAMQNEGILFRERVRVRELPPQTPLERTPAEELEWLLELVKRANTLLIDASCLNAQAPGMNQDSEWFGLFQLWRGMAASSLKKVSDEVH